MRVIVLLVLGSIGTAAAAPKLGTVTKVANAEWSGAAASPDGNWVAYWGRDGLIDLFDVTNRKHARRILPDSFAPGMRLVWSPDSARLAYATDAGIAIYDLATDKTRAVSPHVPTGFASYALAMGFDHQGVLFWMLGRELWRDGVRQPVGKLQATDSRNYSVFGPSAAHRSVLTCVGSEDAQTPGCVEIWITALATGKTRSVFRAAKGASLAFEPHISPTEDRVCYLARELRCIELATGADTAIAFGVGKWGHMGYPALPFSPSGRSLVFAVDRGERTVSFVHDFASGTSRPLADTGHLDRAFLDDNHVVLFENWGTVDEHATKDPVAQLLRIDITTGEQTTLLVTRESYTVPVIIPRHPDLMFSGREIGAGRDFVRIDLPLPPARSGTEPSPTIPTEGTATFYWPNGSKRAEGPMRKGKKHGAWTVYYPNGRPWITGNYFWGQEQDTWSYFHPNGNKGFVLGYHLGAPNGEWTWWSADGKKREAGQYKVGAEDGTWTAWYPSGKKRAEGRHVGGSWSTDSRHFCPDGRELKPGKRC